MPDMNIPRSLRIVVCSALLIKLALFLFVEFQAPRAKIMIDSHCYLESAQMLYTTGMFAHAAPAGVPPTAVSYRSPGYPVFLGFFSAALDQPLGVVVVVQIVCTIVAALLVYQSIYPFNERVAWVSAVVLLFDPAITMYSLLILTESLFLLSIAAFVFAMSRYFQTGRKRMLAASALLLAAATYVRPVSIYLGVAVAVFVLFNTVRRSWMRGVGHALFFLLIVYVLIGAWMVRNHRYFGAYFFTTIENATIKTEGLVHSYARNSDALTVGYPPVVYYASVTARSFVSLMTRPASFKYFDSRGLQVASKIIGYPWVVAVTVGLIVGLGKMPRGTLFYFLVLLMIYFVAITIVAVLWGSGPRFRVPLMPAIAIVAGYGWVFLLSGRKELPWNRRI